MINSRRRELLAVGGAALSSTFAGCLGGSDGNDPATDENNHGHEYGQFLPNTESKLNFALLRVDGVDSMVEFLDPDSAPDSLPAGSVLQRTIRNASFLWGSYSLIFRQYGLYKFIDSDSEPTETDIEWVLVSDAGVTLFGSVGEAEVRDRLQTKLDVQVGEAVTLEESGSRGPYTLYESSETESDETVADVCVSKEAVIVGPTENGLNVAVDDEPSLYQRHAPFRWLVRNAGDGDIISGSYKLAVALDSEKTAYNPGNRGIYSLTFEEESTTLDMAIAFGNIKQQYREALAEDLREDQSSTYLDEKITDKEVEITSMGFTASGSYDFSR